MGGSIMEVYVVRQFFNDCNDTSYSGAHSDFFKAITAAIADAKAGWGTSGYTLTFHEPIDEGSNELWCEVYYEGRPYGIYYTITKMEIDK
jgi:hypothetical protein